MNFKIVYRDKEIKNVSASDSNFPSLIKDGMDSNLLLFMNADSENGSIHIEFGDKCCNIQMDNEEIGEIYGYLDPEQSDEFIDLWANSYPKNMLCYDADRLLKIIKTFAETGEPDPDFEWDVQDM